MSRLWGRHWTGTLRLVGAAGVRAPTDSPEACRLREAGAGALEPAGPALQGHPEPPRALWARPNLASAAVPRCPPPMPGSLPAGCSMRVLGPVS